MDFKQVGTLADLDDPQPPAPTPPNPPAPPAPPTPPAPPAPPTPPAPVEGLNEDGTLQDGYEKDAEGNVVKKATDPPAPLTPEEEVVQFWGTVKNGLGIEYDIDLSSVDAMSPEAVVQFVNTVKEKTEEELERNLRAADPRGFAYLVHRQNGGSDDDFFAQKALGLPERTAFEASADAQAAFLQAKYEALSIPPNIAKLSVDELIKSGKLAETALQAYDQEEEANRNYLERIEQINKQKAEATTKTIQKFQETVGSTLASNDFKFIVPQEKLPDFRKFVNERIRFDGEGFYRVQKVEDTNSALQALYFEYIKGDISKMVMRGVQTKTVQGLRLRANTAVGVGAGGNSGGSDDGKFVPLSDI